MPDDRIKDPTQFVQWADELTDEESVAAVRIIARVQEKYRNKANTVENLEELRDEVLYELMDKVSILAEFDPSPCFHGEPPVVEIKGKISTDAIHKHGFDHEKKEWEVRKAKERGEEYLGQKESAKSRREKRDDGGA